MWIYARYALALALIVGPFGTVNAGVIYNDFYKHFNADSEMTKNNQDPPDDVASWAYAANGADAWGGIIGFDDPTNQLDTFSTIMSNWNGWDPEGGLGEETPGYTTDLTLELYEVDRSGSGAPSPGGLIVEDTESHEIAKRQIPDADNASFAGNGTDFVVDWELGGQSVGSELLFMVRVDGLNGPDAPTNDALNSLNIAAGYFQVPMDVTAGQDTDPGIFWRRPDAENSGIQRFTAPEIPAEGGVSGGGQVFARASSEEGAASIPLPGTLGLLLGAFAGLGLVQLPRRKAAA